MAMSSERFEAHEDELKTLYEDTKRKIKEKIPKCYGEEKKKAVREVERHLEEAALIIQEMEEECKQAPGGYRTQMLSRVRGYKQNVDTLQRDLRKSGSSYSQEDTVGFGRENDLDSMASSQRAHLLSGTEALNRTTASIGRSQRVAAETDQVGAEIIDELGTQRESLVRTRDRLIDTDSNLTRSRKILNTMRRRVMTNKLILIVIIGVELIILGLIIYFKFFS